MTEDRPVRGLRRLELRTADPVASAEHYRTLYGWIVTSAEDGSLRCWVGDRLAALVRKPASWERPGWHVVFGGREAALIVDPAGVSATLDPGRVRHGPWAPPPRHGEPCWIELMTAAATDEHWTTELDWSLRPAGANTEVKTFGLYTVSGEDDPAGGERVIAGRLTVDQATAAEVGATWMCYLAVSDIELTVMTSVNKGGTLLIEPREVETGLLAAVADPHGTVCTLLQDPPGWGGAWSES